MSERTVILTLCHIRKQGDQVRCTFPPLHAGDHRHAYLRIDWPRRPGETQAS